MAVYKVHNLDSSLNFCFRYDSILCQGRTVKQAYYQICRECSEAREVCAKCGKAEDIVER